MKHIVTYTSGVVTWENIQLTSYNYTVITLSSAHNTELVIQTNKTIKISSDEDGHFKTQWVSDKTNPHL